MEVLEVTLVDQASTSIQNIGLPPERDVTLSAVRRTVRGLLENMPGYQNASGPLKKRAAKRLVEVSMAAADLLAQDAELSHGTSRPLTVTSAMSVGQAGSEGAQILKSTKDAIDFPSFVQSLITGVFSAISQSNLSQLERLVGLLDNVAASTSDFVTQNISDADAITWAASKFPFFKVAGESGAVELELDENTDLEEAKANIRTQLEASKREIDAIQEDELGETFIPLVKRKMARDRQSILATMVQLGLQRVVVDEGRLHASMDLRVDTDAVRERQKDQQTDFRLNSSASGQAGGLGWGVRASVDTTVGYVKSDSEYSKDEIKTRAGLRSSVDLAFRTEQVPLDRLADQNKRVKIKSKAPTAVEVAGKNTALTSSDRKLTRKTFTMPDKVGTGDKKIWEDPTAPGSDPTKAVTDAVSSKSDKSNKTSDNKSKKSKPTKKPQKTTTTDKKNKKQ